MNDILKLLEGGDLRSKGKSEEVVEIVKKNLKLVRVLIKGLFNKSELIRMRSADALEKVTINNFKILLPYKKILLSNLDNFLQKEVRWHLAPILSRLEFSSKELEIVFKKLFDWYNTDESNIVKVFSLQSLADISLKYNYQISDVKKLVKQNMKDGSPSLKSRCKKLIEYFKIS